MYMCVCILYFPYYVCIYTYVSLVVQLVKHLPAIQEPGFNPWVGKTPWRREWQPTPVFLPGESMDRGAWRATVHGVHKELDTTE